MSPVSPVFHTMRIGLKTKLEWDHPFYRIRCPCYLEGCSTPLFFSESRIRYPRGAAHTIQSVTFIMEHLKNSVFRRKKQKRLKSTEKVENRKNNFDLLLVAPSNQKLVKYTT